jgi:hypothetical protein
LFSDKSALRFLFLCLSVRPSDLLLNGFQKFDRCRNVLIESSILNQDGETAANFVLIP